MPTPPSPDETATEAAELIDTLLGHLGFPVQVESMRGTDDQPRLQLFSSEAQQLIGRRGERLDDLQYLTNRLLNQRNPSHTRVRLDIEHYRARREERLLEKVQSRAEHVRHTGESVTLQPMNSYDRSLVHELFKEDARVSSHSHAAEDGKLKSIILSARKT